MHGLLTNPCWRTAHCKHQAPAMQRLLLCCLKQNLSESNLESKHLFGLPVLLEGADGPHRAAKDLAAAASQDTAQTAQGCTMRSCPHAALSPCLRGLQQVAPAVQGSPVQHCRGCDPCFWPLFNFISKFPTMKRLLGPSWQLWSSQLSGAAGITPHGWSLVAPRQWRYQGPARMIRPWTIGPGP